MLEIKDKKVTVIGLSKRSGVAATKLLSQNGAKVIVSDVKNSVNLQEEINLIDNCNVEFDLGGHSEKSLNSDLIVVSPGVPLNIPFFEKAKKMKIPVISEIELAYNFTKAKIIAVTGTNGKTTTTSIIGEILIKALDNVKIAGNIGIPLSKVVLESPDVNWIVVEISSFQLETIKTFRPYISVFLNFTPDHLDRHHTEKNYWNAKKKIFKNQKQSNYALINYDQKKVVSAVEDCKAKVLGVSYNTELEYGAFVKQNKLICKLPKKDKFKMSLNNILLPGKHNIMNVAFAALVSKIMNINSDIIKNVISNFELDKHRLEKLGLTANNVLIIDDSKATNPDAAIKALNAYQRPIILIAGGQDRNADFKQLAKNIKQKVKSLILIGETQEKIKNAVKKIGFDNIDNATDMKEAVAIAVKKVQSGDCLMLSPACPSWDMYASYKERGNKFKKEINKFKKSNTV